MNHNEIKADFSSGFSVALVALPLSIGIALASGAPASAGLIAAIIGGILGSWLGGAHVTINGPAAGLIVIVLDATMELGFKGMLGAAVVAGVLQTLMGALKLGRKGSLFPASVVHGMMAAIGIIIIAKQTHILIGHVPVAKNPIMLIAEIPGAFGDFKPLVLIVGVLSLALLIVWNLIQNPVLKKVPAPLLGVIFGAGCGSFLGLESSALLNIPSDLRQWIIFPDFTYMQTFIGWKTALTLAIVGSLETVLSATAVDKIDPLKRKTDLDRDLLSKGLCNIVSGLLGGLPMIAEIVRSSANVSYGGRSWKSNFFHGLVILLAVIFLPRALNLIPLSALAAILVMIGWRLGSPKHFKHALEIGKDHLVGFVVTMIITLGVDLLVGILCGVLSQYLVEIFLGTRFKNSFKSTYQVVSNEDKHRFEVQGTLIFSNFLSLKEGIMKVATEKKELTLDLSRCDYIDHSVMEQIDEIKSFCQNQKTAFTLIISPDQHPLGQSTLSGRRRAS
jgi:MFS superfamily sulfate permease-like transporter